MKLCPNLFLKAACDLLYSLLDYFFPKIIFVLWKKSTNALWAKREHGSIFREEKLHVSLRLSFIFDNSLLDTEPESTSLSHTMGSYGLGSGKRRNCVWKDL